MATTPFIGRREAIGLGKEGTSGTPVSPTSRLPKTKGIMQPKYNVATDSSGYGNIDEVFDTQTTKYRTEASLSGIIRDDFSGNLLMGAMGTHTPVVAFTGTASGGTPARGDIVRQGSTFGTATWVGVLKKILTINAVVHYFVSTTSGSLADSTPIMNNPTVWTIATPLVTANAAIKGHLFERLNNNNHPSYTIYGADPIQDAANQSSYAPYCMVNKFDMIAKVGEFVTFDVDYMGKQMVTTSKQSPAYTTANPFLAKHAHVYFANTEALLSAATAVCMQEFKFSMALNLQEIQCFGSTDIDSIHNQQLTLSGDLTALFEDVTLRDYVVNSTKKAARFQMINTDATALVAGVYPSITIDLAKVGFIDWKKSEDLNKIVDQTMGYKGQFDTTTNMSLEILLLNSQTAAY